MNDAFVSVDGTVTVVLEQGDGVTVTPLNVESIIPLNEKQVANHVKKAKTHDIKFDTVKQEIVYKRRTKK